MPNREREVEQYFFNDPEKGRKNVEKFRREKEEAREKGRNKKEANGKEDEEKILI